MTGTRLVDRLKFVQGLQPITPSSSTPDYVKLSAYTHLTIVIEVRNATTVTGSAITLKQATDAAGTSEKALSFSKVWANTDTGSADTLTETTVSSDTFTTDATNSKNLMYVFEVDATDLDKDNGFYWVRAGTGNATAATLSITYILSGVRYGGNLALLPTAIA